MRWLLGVGLGYLGVEMTCFTILDTGIRTGLLMQEDDQLDNQPKSSSMGNSTSEWGRRTLATDCTFVEKMLTFLSSSEKEETATTVPENPPSLSLGEQQWCITYRTCKGSIKQGKGSPCNVFKGDIYRPPTRMFLVPRSTRGDYAVLYQKHQGRENIRVDGYLG